jgi:hypothetical protein
MRIMTPMAKCLKRIALAHELSIARKPSYLGLAALNQTRSDEDGKREPGGRLETMAQAFKQSVGAIGVLKKPDRGQEK